VASNAVTSIPNYFELNALKIGTKHMSKQALRVINTLCFGGPDALYFFENKISIDF